MSQPRSIADFFTKAPAIPSSNPNQSSPPAADSRSTSFASPHIPPPHSQPESSPTQGGGTGSDAIDKTPQESIPGSQGGSFNSSQRVVKKGKVIVTSSDGDDSESLSSLDDPDELLGMFKTSRPKASEEPEKESTPDLGQPSNPWTKTKDAKKKLPPWQATPTYKFSLESLLMDTLDENEVEANITKIKKTLEASQNEAPRNGNNKQKAGGHHQMLASAMGVEEGDSGFQRLVDAVNRTGALSHDQSWSFFEDKANCQPTTPEPFPDNVVSDDPAIAALKVPSEPRDHIRYAYCRSFDFAPRAWVSSNLRPSHIEALFLKLGARPIALNVSESLESTIPSLHDSRPPDWGRLISVINLLGKLAKKFADDTREYALNILIRLTVDTTLMMDCGVCSEAENAIAELLNEASQTGAESLQTVTKSIYQTIKEPEFRAQLLKHITPITPSISLVRCRLALSFFFQDPSLLEASTETLFDLNRISTRLKDKRFKFNRLQSQRGQQFDFSELAAFTTFLDIGICPGPALTPSPSSESSAPSPETIKSQKAREAQFNADVDLLATRLKAVFSSIEDSGASHLKRTETKERLESLYYRVLYSVRTKPQPKKAFFDPSGPEEWSGMGRSGAFMDRFLTKKDNSRVGNEKSGKREEVRTDGDIPIREHAAE
ncbi:hypothetical protein FQN54_002364 [Arachnomyces sp. PD_36]|nr:hypothetical protein FQN54_002364 [Arachnomyces sp. PD_36]